MEKLTKWLEKAKKRPSHFAKELGVSPSTITRCLRGEQRLSPALAKKISEKTGIPPADLLFS